MDDFISLSGISTKKVSSYPRSNSYIEERFKIDKNHNGFKRLCSDIILSAFNDILSIDFYQYHTINWLKNKSKNSKKLLMRHYESIDWLLNERNHFAFEGLGIENYSMEKIQFAISKKFNSNNRFKKTSLDRPKRIF